MEAFARVRKVGGSLTITVPKEIAEIEGIQENEPLDLEVEVARKSYLGAFKWLPPFTREDEFDVHE